MLLSPFRRRIGLRDGALDGRGQSDMREPSGSDPRVNRSHATKLSQLRPQPGYEVDPGDRRSRLAQRRSEERLERLRQLCDLDEVAAGVVEDGRGDAAHLCGSWVNRTPFDRSRSNSAWTSSIAKEVYGMPSSATFTEYQAETHETQETDPQGLQ